MAVRRVIQIGDPILRRRAADVPSAALGSPELRDLVLDLVDTMHSAGGIGIAAPQIGESVRAAAIEITADSTRYPDMQPFPLAVFINPVITTFDANPQEFWEGCLSVPGLRGLVARPRGVRVDYLDAYGSAHSITADGFLATVLQHELDHLDGVLFVDRIRDTTRLSTIENYIRFWRESQTDTPEEV
jgi:peptide deformylase